VTFGDSLHHGEYRDFSNGEGMLLEEGSALEMKPWTYRLFERAK
jgi:hypothetical protein